MIHAPSRLLAAEMKKESMKRSDLINALANEFDWLALRDVELAVHCMLEQMVEAMASGQRIEIRGFGSFTLHYCPARLGRNPKTGESVALGGKYRPHFKPGKALRERVNLPEALRKNEGKVDHEGIG